MNTSSPLSRVESTEQSEAPVPAAFPRIWAAIAEHDDWRPFENKIAAIRRMGEAMQGSGDA